MRIDVSNTSRYYAYSNYLVATSRLMRRCHPRDDLFAANIMHLPGYQKIRRQRGFDIDRIAEFLRNSWFTEVLLSEVRKYPDFLPYSNPWAMVQAYYSVYLTIRAYFLAFNRYVTTSHQKTLGTICNDLTSCKDRFPEPWCCVLDGDTNVRPIFLKNSSCKDKLSLSNALVSPHYGDPWQHFMLFLKTTRDRQINARILQWKAHSRRKRILRHERSALVSKLRPTSFFDALYRIRARSNYEDVDSFTFGNVDSSAADELHDALCEIIYCTLFLFEMMIAKLIGERCFSRLVSPFLRSNPGKSASSTLGRRWEIIRGYT